jgi:two-component system NtrC family response regulator
MARILLIDDDRSLREVVTFQLTEAGHEVLPAADGEVGLARLVDHPDLVITDIRMPGIDGMEVLRRLLGDDPAEAPPVIMFTAHGTVEQAVEAMRLGAFTYLLKPFSRDELLLTVEQALHIGDLERENRQLRQQLKATDQTSGIVYASRSMKELMAEVRQAAASDATIHIAGESGTGKELVARACHDLSDRWEGPFVAVNCGAIPGELMESELFGHAKGAFTGAERPAEGRIRAAGGGTLFLDEIAELPLELQPKLLRVLETRSVDPVGQSQPVPVDFRLVCASHRDLEKEVAEGRFREDLYYRIQVLQIGIPPLRERADDIQVLWEHFTRIHGGPELISDPDLLAELRNRPWRGNVRELKNVNQRLVLMRKSESLTLADLKRLAPAAGVKRPASEEHLPDESGLPLGPFPEEGLSLVDMEKEIIRRALQKNGGNRSKAAAYLGIARHVLVYRIDKYDLA